MSTFNLAGSSVLGVTPKHQCVGTSPIQFVQLPFNIKTAVAFNSTNYWRVQGSTLRFLSIGAVTKVRALRGVSMYAFDPGQYQILTRIYPRMLGNTGSNAFVMSTTNTSGIGRSKIKNQGFHVSQTGDAVVATPTRLSVNATTSFTFTSNVVGKRTLKRSGVNTFTVAQTPAVVRGRALSGNSALTFISSGDQVYNANPLNVSSVVFGQSNGVKVTKSVNASHTLNIVNGGFGLVY